MTRKITLSIVLLLLIFCCYETIFGKNEFFRNKVLSVKELQVNSKNLSSSTVELERLSTVTFEEQKEALSKEIKEYQTAKEEYESIVPDEIEETVVGIDENDLKDIYDVDFLWTIVGNYATEEGINLTFNINKNTSSALAMNNTSSNYTVCDLKFTITGKYINLTDFICDLEDDDRLNFEINDFYMQKSGEELQVTLNVKEIKVNSDNLIESGVGSGTSQSTTKNSLNTQTIDPTTSNASESGTTNTMTNTNSNVN